jgi:hypothetical protein
MVAKGNPSMRAAAAVTAKAAPELPAAWSAGASDPRAARDVLGRLRPLDADAAIAAVAAASKAGASAATLWDAMRLRACELLLNRPGLLAVHPLTSLNAFRTVAARSRTDGTRRAALLQCAAWLGNYRGDLRVGDGELHLDELTPRAAAGSPAEVLEVAADDREEAIGRALHHGATPAGRAALAEAARAVLVRKAQEHHDYKFAAAAFEEARAAHEELAPFVLASAFSYLRHARTDDSGDVRQALVLLGA